MLSLALIFSLCCCSQAFAQERSFEFSGYQWVTKSSRVPIGPGPNYFSESPEDVWVDANGKLHLTITKRGSRWYATEIRTKKTFGYGTYEFVVEGRPELLDPNVVFGMFTWNYDTYKTDANSEIDVEFAKWGDPKQRPLQYSVHPTRGPDYPGVYGERFFEGDIAIIGGVSRHRFTWTPEHVEVMSFIGDAQEPHARWICDDFGGPRRAMRGGKLSDPILIPKPGEKTRTHINLWLADMNRDGKGDPPKDGERVEIAVRSFAFTPIEP